MSGGNYNFMGRPPPPPLPSLTRMASSTAAPAPPTEPPPSTDLPNADRTESTKTTLPPPPKGPPPPSIPPPAKEKPSEAEETLKEKVDDSQLVNGSASSTEKVEASTTSNGTEKEGEVKREVTKDNSPVKEPSATVSSSPNLPARPPPPSIPTSLDALTKAVPSTKKEEEKDKEEETKVKDEEKIKVKDEEKIKVKEEEMIKEKTRNRVRAELSPRPKLTRSSSKSSRELSKEKNSSRTIKGDESRDNEEPPLGSRVGVEYQAVPPDYIGEPRPTLSDLNELDSRIDPDAIGVLHAFKSILPSSKVEEKYCSKWTPLERNAFEKAINENSKDFSKISKALRAHPDPTVHKSTRMCIQYYYDNWRISRAYAAWKRNDDAMREKEKQAKEKAEAIKKKELRSAKRKMEQSREIAKREQLKRQSSKSENKAKDEDGASSSGSVGNIKRKKSSKINGSDRKGDVSPSAKSKPWSHRSAEFMPRGSFDPSVYELKTNDEAKDSSEAGEAEMYCVCRGDGLGSMVECAGCNEWFHEPCIGVRKHMLSATSHFRCRKCAIYSNSAELELPSQWSISLNKGELPTIIIYALADIKLTGNVKVLDAHPCPPSKKEPLSDEKRASPTSSAGAAASLKPLPKREAKAGGSDTETTLVKKFQCAEVDVAPVNTREYVILLDFRSVPVWNCERQQLLAGSKAPTVGKLVQFLQENPMYKPFRGSVKRNPCATVGMGLVGQGKRSRPSSATTLDGKKESSDKPKGEQDVKSESAVGDKRKNEAFSSDENRVKKQKTTPPNGVVSDGAAIGASQSVLTAEQVQQQQQQLQALQLQQLLAKQQASAQAGAQNPGAAGMDLQSLLQAQALAQAQQQQQQQPDQEALYLRIQQRAQALGIDPSILQKVSQLEAILAQFNSIPASSRTAQDLAEQQNYQSQYDQLVSAIQQHQLIMHRMQEQHQQQQQHEQQQKSQQEQQQQAEAQQLQQLQAQLQAEAEQQKQAIQQQMMQVVHQHSALQQHQLQIASQLQEIQQKLLSVSRPEHSAQLQLHQQVLVQEDAKIQMQLLQHQQTAQALQVAMLQMDAQVEQRSQQMQQAAQQAAQQAQQAAQQAQQAAQQQAAQQAQQAAQQQAAQQAQQAAQQQAAQQAQQVAQQQAAQQAQQAAAQQAQQAAQQAQQAAAQQAQQQAAQQAAQQQAAAQLHAQQQATQGDQQQANQDALQQLALQMQLQQLQQQQLGNDQGTGTPSKEQELLHQLMLQQYSQQQQLQQQQQQQLSSKDLLESQQLGQMQQQINLKYIDLQNEMEQYTKLYAQLRQQNGGLTVEQQKEEVYLHNSHQQVQQQLLMLQHQHDVAKSQLQQRVAEQQEQRQQRFIQQQYLQQLQQQQGQAQQAVKLKRDNSASEPKRDPPRKTAECPHCSAGYTQRHNLLSHIRAKHPGCPFPPPPTGRGRASAFTASNTTKHDAKPPAVQTQSDPASAVEGGKPDAQPATAGTEQTAKEGHDESKSAEAPKEQSGSEEIVAKEPDTGTKAETEPKVSSVSSTSSAITSSAIESTVQTTSTSSAAMTTAPVPATLPAVGATAALGGESLLPTLPSAAQVNLLGANAGLPAATALLAGLAALPAGGTATAGNTSSENVAQPGSSTSVASATSAPVLPAVSAAAGAVPMVSSVLGSLSALVNASPADAATSTLAPARLPVPGAPAVSANVSSEPEPPSTEEPKTVNASIATTTGSVGGATTETAAPSTSAGAVPAVSIGGLMALGSTVPSLAGSVPAPPLPGLPATSLPVPTTEVFASIQSLGNPAVQPPSLLTGAPSDGATGSPVPATTPSVPATTQLATLVNSNTSPSAPATTVAQDQTSSPAPAPAAAASAVVAAATDAAPAVVEQKPIEDSASSAAVPKPPATTPASAPEGDTTTGGKAAEN